ELDRATPYVQQAILLAEQSGSAEGRGRALRFAGQLHLQRGELDEAKAALDAAREHLSEAGAAWSLGRALNYSGWGARDHGDSARAERLFRQSIRLLTRLEDPAALCPGPRPPPEPPP